MGYRKRAVVDPPAALLLLVAVGCLPDPRPYDACTDDEGYYRVAPVGCEGHEVTVLETRTFDAGQTLMPPYGDGTGTLVLDETYVYWPDMAGNILRTPKQGGRTDVLIEAGGGEAPLALADAETHLYALRSTSTGTSQSNSASLFAVEKATDEVTEMASLPYTDASQLVVFAGKFYARDLAQLCIIEGSLGGGDAVVPSYPCVTNELPLKFRVTERGIVYISLTTGAPSIVLQPLDGSTPEVLMTLQNYPTSLRNEGEELYFTECSDVCRRYRIFATGTSDLLVANLGMASYVEGDSKTTYALTQLEGEYGGSRLYGWKHPSPSPNVVAASLGGLYALTVDDDDLFALVPDFDGGPNLGRLQLLRISR